MAHAELACALVDAPTGQLSYPEAFGCFQARACIQNSGCFSAQGDAQGGCFRAESAEQAISLLRTTLEDFAAASMDLMRSNNLTHVPSTPAPSGFEQSPAPLAPEYILMGAEFTLIALCTQASGTELLVCIYPSSRAVGLNVRDAHERLRAAQSSIQAEVS